MASSMLDSTQLQLMRDSSRVWVGFSGGLDSSLLLHLLNEAIPGRVAALHYNHRISPQSDSWQAHCQAICDSLDVPFTSARAEKKFSPSDLEQQARDARYRFFFSHVQAGECLALAHHADDQVETLFLRLMRGSGLRGLCAIPWSRTLGEALIVRPMMASTREQLLQEAQKRHLEWIEDESNKQLVQDRNWLRNRLLPGLEERWPDVPARIQRVVANLQSAAELQQEYVEQLLSQIEVRSEVFGLSFDAKKWCQCSDPAGRALLEHLARELGEYGLPSDACSKLIEQLVQSREDAQPLLKLGSIEARRFAGRIYLLVAMPAAWKARQWDGRAELMLGPGMSLQGDWQAGDYLVRPRQEGDRIQLRSEAGSRLVKQLMQEEAIPPWIRPLMPLVVQAGNVVAIADLVAVNGMQSPASVCHLPGWKPGPLFRRIGG